MQKEQFLINWFQWCYWSKWSLNIDKCLQDPLIYNDLSDRVFLGVVQGIFNWLPILLYCGYFRCLFILVLLRLVRGNPMICFLISKLMTLKRASFSFGYLLVLLIFFSPHVYAKFDSFKSVAVDSIFAVPGSVSDANKLKYWNTLLTIAAIINYHVKKSLGACNNLEAAPWTVYSNFTQTRSSNFQLQQLVKGAGNSKCIGNGINKNISQL